MSREIWNPGLNPHARWCLVVVALFVVLGVGTLACSHSGSGGGQGPFLQKIEGPTVLGPGGKTHLSVLGSGTGPITWSLLPTGLGDFVVDKSAPILQPTSPPPGYHSEGTFLAGFTLGTCDLSATAGMGTASYRSTTTLRIVHGISIVPSNAQVTLTPRYQKEISAPVLHPNFPPELISQGVTWFAEGDFADGQILPWLPGKLLFNAPSIPGTYAIKGKAEADPLATVLIQVTVQ